MSETVPSRRRWAPYVALGLVILAGVVLTVWYLTSARFEEQMRRKLVAELQQMTGGRAELRSFHWRLSRLEFEARDLTIHGLESSDQTPYMHADRLLLRLKVLSLLRRQLAIRQLELEHPVVHIIVYADGSTNQPAPGTKVAGDIGFGRLFDLAIDRLQVEHGELLWNNQRVPLDFTARSVRATLSHAAPISTYDARIQVGAVDAKYGGFQPLQGRTELQLLLAPGKVELSSFRFVSNRSTLEAHGSLTDFRNPKAQLVYKGSLDVVEFGDLLRIPELRRGTLEVDGQGTYYARNFTSSGRLVLKNGEWRARTLRVPELNAAALYSLTRDRLAISNLTAQALGGLISGSIEVSNWGAVGPSQRGVGHLRFSGVQIGALARAVSTPRLPLDRIDPAGAAHGTVDLEWAGSPRDLNAAFVVDVEPPASPRPGQLPVTARAEAVYHGKQAIIDISQLNLATPATRFSATGVLGSTSARLSVSLNTRDVAELQPILTAFRKPTIPGDVHGRASFTGSVIGRLAGPTISGHLEISDFDTEFAAGPSPRIHWDWLATDLVYSPDELSLHRGLLRREAAHARFDLTAGLQDGAWQDSSPLRGRVSITGADLQDIQ